MSRLRAWFAWLLLLGGSVATGCAGVQGPTETAVAGITRVADPVYADLATVCHAAELALVQSSDTQGEARSRIAPVRAACKDASQAFELLIRAQLAAVTAAQSVDTCAEGQNMTCIMHVAQAMAAVKEAAEASSAAYERVQEVIR